MKEKLNGNEAAVPAGMFMPILPARLLSTFWIEESLRRVDHVLQVACTRRLEFLHQLRVLFLVQTRCRAIDIVRTRRVQVISILHGCLWPHTKAIEGWVWLIEGRQRRDGRG